jgi:pimeloyl-ACP methyl ester carboxylesterase
MILSGVIGMSYPKDVYFDVNGQKIYAKQWSGVGIPLIFLHHIGGACGIWDTVAPDFVDDYQVLAVDLRGHGFSSNPPKGYRWAEDMAEDVVQLIQRLDTESVVLAGFSLGALVSIPVTVRLSGKVSALILEDPPLYDQSRCYGSAWWEERRLFIHLSLEEKVEGFIKEGYAPEEARRRAEGKHRMSPGVMDEFLDGTAAYDYEKWLPKVTCPTMAFLGNPEKGSVLTEVDRERIMGQFQFARISTWDNAGHGVHEVDPPKFVKEMNRFLKEENLLKT